MLFTLVLATLTVGSDPERYERWVEEKRLDLCAEAIIQCGDDRQAERLADLLLPFRKAHIPDPSGYAGPVFRGKDRPRYPLWAEQYKGDSVFVPAEVAFTLVRAGKCTVEEVNRAAYFVAVRDRITEQFRVQVQNHTGEWFRSVVIIGSPAEVPRANLSLVICDGDLKVKHFTDFSALIANGDIEFLGSLDRSRVYAAGKITTVQGRVSKTELRESGKDMPVRFLDLRRDLGLRVTDKLVLEDDWRGLRKGDLVTKVGGVPVASLQGLRKEIRRGVVQWMATVEVRRGSETVRQLVWLDLNPDPAPQPAKP